MKENLLVIILFCSVFCNAQGNDILVQYRIHNNTAIPNSLLSGLAIHNHKVIYIEDYSTQTFESKLDEGTVINKGTTFDPYTLFDYEKGKVCMFETINGNIFYIEDTIAKLDWKVSADSKEIAGYTCVKAETTFRGRTWVAWFAPEIAVPYGPWKLHGLPGLIIEAYDETKTYTMQMSKLDFSYSDLFDKDFKSLFQQKNKEPITYKEFVTEHDEFLQNTGAKTRAHYGNGDTGGVKTAVRSGKELKYEWEE